MSVVEAVERELERMPDDLAGSALAAGALAMAQELDSGRNSATSKSMCMRALQDVLKELRDLAPVERKEDEVDALAARRARRLRVAGGTAAKDLPVS